MQVTVSLPTTVECYYENCGPMPQFNGETQAWHTWGQLRQCQTHLNLGYVMRIQPRPKYNDSFAVNWSALYYCMNSQNTDFIYFENTEAGIHEIVPKKKVLELAIHNKPNYPHSGYVVLMLWQIRGEKPPPVQELPF